MRIQKSFPNTKYGITGEKKNIQNRFKCKNSGRKFPKEKTKLKFERDFSQFQMKNKTHKLKRQKK